MCRASTEQKASATGIYCRNIERQGISASEGSTENENGLAQRDIAFYSLPHLLSQSIRAFGNSEWPVGCFRQLKLWVRGVHMRKAVFFAICFAILAATAYGQSSSTMADDQVNASYLQGVKPYSRATGSNADGGGCWESTQRERCWESIR
jgi:hypothetical protein